MRNYSIAALFTLSISCVGACGGTNGNPGDGSGAAGETSEVAGSAGKGSMSGGSANTEGGSASQGGKATGGTGVTGGTASTAGSGGAETAGTAGTENPSGGTAGTNAGGGAAGAAGTGITPGGGSGGTSGGSDVGGTGGTAGSDVGGTSGTAGSDVGGTSGTAGSDVGGTSGTAGSDVGGTSGTAGSDVGGTSGTGGTGAIGGSAGSGGSGGAGGSSPGSVCAEANEGYELNLTCAGTSVVSGITFASYGTPTGSCGSYIASDCDSSMSFDQVEAACLGKNSCSVGANNGVFGDPCGGTYKHMYVEATCSNCGNGVVDAGEACDDGVNDGVLCSADCSTQPEVAQIHLHCDAGSEVLNALSGTDCIVIAPGGASYITFSSNAVAVTLYSNTDCTGNTATVSSDLNFCDGSFDQGGGLNDQVGSVRVQRK